MIIGTDKSHLNPYNYKWFHSSQVVIIKQRIQWKLCRKLSGTSYFAMDHLITILLFIWTYDYITIPNYPQKTGHLDFCFPIDNPTLITRSDWQYYQQFVKISYLNTESFYSDDISSSHWNSLSVEIHWHFNVTILRHSTASFRLCQNTCCYAFKLHSNSLWPSDTIGWHSSDSTFIGLGNGLTAPKHNLYQCWLSPVRSSDKHLRPISWEILQLSIMNSNSKI